MTCRNCRYFDENETQGSKGHCDWLGIYVYPDDSTCSHFEKRGSGGGCYLTTACCDYRHLPDDCRELGAMRKLRDDYLRNSEEGRLIVADYYSTAPAIVRRIDASPTRDDLYGYIYGVVSTCADLVEVGYFEGAKGAYLGMLGKLEGLVA